jgi:glycosyltransferase involved in cell wall biosynthesis
MKKKIIFFMPSFEGGGVEKNIILIANYFIKKNPSISIITSSKHIKNKFNNKIKFISPISRLWDKYGRIPKYLICIFLLLKEYKKDKSFHVFCFQGNAVCLIFCKLLRIKIIVRPNSSPSGWSKNIIKKFLFSKILSLSDLIIVNSLKFKLEMKKKFNLNTKCIYNPLNIKEIKKLSKKKIKFKFFTNDHVNLISVGRLVYQKDHITLLKAINEIKDKIKIKLLIIGEGNQKLNLISFIQQNNLEKIVKIKDRTENPFPYILKSEIMILSSKFEGLPNILLEALTLKKFIISSNCPTGPSEILDSGKGGFLFKVGNFKNLGNKILTYKKQKAKCKKIKKFAVKRLERFDFERNLLEYFNIFNKL